MRYFLTVMPDYSQRHCVTSDCQHDTAGMSNILSGLHLNLMSSSCFCLGAADQKIALLGAMQSLFEGSMYTFVFLWTPSLSPKGEHLPHGMIFSCFMVRA